MIFLLMYSYVIEHPLFLLDPHISYLCDISFLDNVYMFIHSVSLFIYVGGETGERTRLRRRSARLPRLGAARLRPRPANRDAIDEHLGRLGGGELRPATYRSPRRRGHFPPRMNISRCV